MTLALALLAGAGVASLPLTGAAQDAAALYVGPAEGEYNRNKTIASDDADVEISAALWLPAESLERYAGCSLSAVHAALVSKLNIDRLDVWVRTDLDGPDLAGGSSETPSKGWNSVDLSEPLTLSAGQGLYLGYTFHQKNAAMGLSALENPGHGSLWVKMPGGEWTDRSAEGTLAIEAVLTGSALPRYDLRLDAISPDLYLVTQRPEYKVSGTVKNIGAATLGGYDVQVSFPGVGGTYTQRVEAELPYGTSHDFEVTVLVEPTTSEAADFPVEVTVLPWEGTEHWEADNTLQGTYRIVPYDMTRRILVEEFTTESCPNCPRVAGYLHEALAKEEFKDAVVPVVHHSAYGTDRHTSPWDEEFLFFYDRSYIYAPSVMIDRTLWGGSECTSNPASLEGLEQGFRNRLAVPAQVALLIEAENTGSEMKVTARGVKGTDTLCENPHIVVVVTEDDVPAVFQAGADDPVGYRQEHVTRAMNGAWGEPLTFDGDEYEYSCTLDLDPEWRTTQGQDPWKAENLNVVAYIFNYAVKDRHACEVMNAALLPATNILSSAPLVTDDDASLASSASTGWYTPTGLYLGTARPTAPGLYLHRTPGATRKHLIP